MHGELQIENYKWRTNKSATTNVTVNGLPEVTESSEDADGLVLVRSQ